MIGHAPQLQKAASEGPTKVNAVLLPVILPVVSDFDVPHARRITTDMAIQLGFSPGAICRLATAVSELVNNLVIHAKARGLMTLTPLTDGRRHGIEMIVEDDDPGIHDIGMAMTDGFTTQHGLGSGLPGTPRLMDEFTIISAPGRGTRVTAPLWR